jgi:multiple sugar transport system permease protein
MQHQDRLVAVLFITPLVLLVLAVTFLPIINAVVWSAHSTYYTKTLEFIGFGNYINIFTKGSAIKSITNSVWYTLGSLAVVFPVGVILAVLLNQHFPLRSMYRTMIIIPWVISQTITAMLYRWMYNSSYGIIVYLIDLLTGNRLNILADMNLAKIATVYANAWNTMPVVIVMTLAALQSISSDIYEAASVDGSSTFNTFWKITLPLLKPTLGVTLITQSIEYFSMVTLINTLTDGGPFKATQTLSVYAYREGLVYWDLGESSAICMLILVCNVLFSLIYIKLLNRNKD